MTVSGARARLRRSLPRLLDWFAETARPLPWRADRDPYRIWVSEIMLQQTTVEVVRERYVDFLERFPSLEALAAAEQDAVLQCWSGLGYYRRARALHEAAGRVTEQHGGRLPGDEAALRALPGIGTYTARAILAQAFDQPVIAVDGNVARVLARLFDDDSDVSREAVRRRLSRQLRELLPPRACGRFAEALIELGALVCRPRDPDCAACPLSPGCAARLSGRAAELPSKPAARRATPVLSLRALLQRRAGILLVRRHAGASLLPGFWELPGAWCDEDAHAAEVLPACLRALGLRRCSVDSRLAAARHAITHHRIRAEAWSVHATGTPRDPFARLVPASDIDALHLTTETRKLLSGVSSASSA